MRIGLLAIGILISNVETAILAESSYPMLMGLHPVVVPQGQTIECEATSRYSMAGAYQVFVSGDGVTAEAEAAAKETVRSNRRGGTTTKIKVRFKATADAALGVRDVRIATPQGVSTVGQVVVVRDPVVKEAANNDTLKTAQAVTLPATVCGTIEKAEDVDFYKFTVAAGTALTFHVWCQRLENRIHDLQEHADPIITLRNASGTVLAANDNYFFGDPILHHKFTTAGDYYLEIRDVRYAGNVFWHYAIEIHDRPFVVTTNPPRVVPGTTSRVQLIGFNLPADPSATLDLPANVPDGVRWVSLKLPNGQLSNATPVAVSRVPEILENPGDNNTVAKAQAIPIPAGVAGRIETEGDVDCYVFDAKAGEKFTFEVIARDCQSSLDSTIRILNDKGQRLIENDDARDRFLHADSLIENWAAPSNGRFVIEIRDLHLRGGPGFTYFLRVTRSQPYFTMETDSDKTLLTPGNTAVIFARVARKNGFAGEVKLNVEGLPPGVIASCGRVLATGNDGCILLRAAPDAKQIAANIRITGTAEHKEGDKTMPLSAVARPLQEIYMPGGGRHHYPVEMHTLSVDEPSEIKSVKITPANITLKPGEAKKIEITIDRAVDFKGTVTLDVVYQHLGSIFGNSLPPGVTVDDKNSQTLLSSSQSSGFITLKAAPDAKPVKDQQVPVMAHVSINFVMKYTYCGEPLLISIVEK